MMYNDMTTYVATKDSKNMNIIQLRWRGVLFVLAVATLIFLLYYNIHRPKYSYKCSDPYWEESSLNHLSRYCNYPNNEVTGDEGSVPSDSPYQLQSVHILIRHGDRFNMHSLPNYDNHKVSCIISPEIKEQFPFMEGYQTTMENLASQGGRTSEQSFHAYNLYPNKATCDTAQLTPIGATQHVRNGHFLKTAYVDQWKLLDEDKIFDQLMIRCTTKSRTFQSALALMYGFLPELDLTKLQMEPALNNSMCTKNSGPHCGCDSVTQGIDLFSCNYQQRSPHLLAEPKMRDAYAQIADVLGVASNNLPPPSHIFDINMVHYCHQLPLPYRRGQCMQPWSMKNIYEAVNDNGKVQVKNKVLQKIVRLKLYPLMSEISERMTKQLKGESSLKFVLYSGHDSTVEPFATAMGFSTGIWSRYATRIALELYTDSKQKGYIRVVSNGKTVTKDVLFCKDSIVNDKLGLCPLENFLDFVDHGCMESINEKSYDKACEKSFPLR